MKLCLYALSLTLLSNANAACETEQMNVDRLKSEKLAIKAVYATSSAESSKYFLLAAKAGDPLALGVVAQRDGISRQKKLEFLRLAAAMEESGAAGEYAMEIRDLDSISKGIPKLDYAFQLTLSEVRQDASSIDELLKVAIRSRDKAHLIASIFWASMIIPKMHQSINRANAIEHLAQVKKMLGAFAADVDTRAALYLCRNPNIVVFRK